MRKAVICNCFESKQFLPNCLVSFLIALVLGFGLMGCGPQKPNNQLTLSNKEKVQLEVKKKIDLMGHRNWVLLVDSAFPEQNSVGTQTIMVEGGILENLEWLLDMTNAAPHVDPKIYRDLELDFLKDDMVDGISDFKVGLERLFKNKDVNPLLHDKVFELLDQEAALFSVLVIKTEELMPYTSVFLRLDCGYWDEEQEQALRNKMNQ